jgi:cytochrome c peroxidase
MAAIFRVEYTAKNKKVVQWFDSNEEAVEHLKKVYAQDAIDRIPHNGNLRVQAFIDAVPDFLEKMETIQDNISQWIPPQHR